MCACACACACACVRACMCACVRVCVCVCVCFGMGEEEKEVGAVGDLSASSSFGPTDTHSGFVHGITDHDAPSLVVYFGNRCFSCEVFITCKLHLSYPKECG